MHLQMFFSSCRDAFVNIFVTVQMIQTSLKLFTSWKARFCAPRSLSRDDTFHPSPRAQNEWSKASTRENSRKTIWLQMKQINSLDPTLDSIWSLCWRKQFSIVESQWKHVNSLALDGRRRKNNNEVILACEMLRYNAVVGVRSSRVVLLQLSNQLLNLLQCSRLVVTPAFAPNNLIT